MESRSPQTIDAVAIHRRDVVQAFELRERRQEPAVLRVTPPFSGRMRGRLHISDDDPYQPGTANAPIHIVPTALLTDPPSFPMPDQTTPVAQIASDYDPDQHHTVHSAAVEEWRTTIAHQITDSITVSLPAGTLSARVVVLGKWPPDRKPES